MNIFVTTMFFLPLGLIAYYLYVSGAFTNRRAFPLTFFILLSFCALIIGIGGIQLFYQGNDLPATTPVALSESLLEP
jgi:hypothetical protein